MKYKLRAECAQDVIYFIADPGIIFKSFQMKRIADELPDVEFEFETEAWLELIKLILDLIGDSHVMIETLAPIDQYTGERHVIKNSNSVIETLKEAYDRIGIDRSSKNK
jgi:hypothetical protein